MHNASRGMASIFNLDTKPTQLQATSPHYTDELDRFTRDFATEDRHRRQHQRQKKKQSLQERRNHRMQEDNYRIQMESQILEQENRNIDIKKLLVREGIKMNAHMNSIPFNPISLEYQNSGAGYRLYQQDEDRKVRGLVRAKLLEERSSPGYNVVSGIPNIYVQRMVPSIRKVDFDSQTLDYKKKFLMY